MKLDRYARVSVLNLFLISAMLLTVQAYAEQVSEEDMRERMSAWVAKAQSAVKERLKDPGSVEWGALQFHWGVKGAPMVCGEVNAKNSYGGYSGKQRFVSAGRAELTYLESDVEDMAEVWSIFCSDKYNDIAVERYGKSADIAPIRFR